MTGKRYFQISLLGPIVLPICATAFFFTGIKVLETFAAVLFFSLIYMGPAYLIFGCIVLLATRNMQVSRIRKISYYSPLLFLLFVGVTAVTVEITGVQQGALKAMLPTSVYALVIGYMYVGIINLVYEIFFDEQQISS